MLKKIISGKASISAALIAIVFMIFIGCFVNAPRNMDESFSGKYWYYINRGYPEPWAGLALANSKVDFPLIRMPLLHAEDERGTKLVKIIDLSKFIPIFIVAFIASYIPTYVLAKAVDENKKLFPLILVVNTTLIVIGLFIYFSWFSRV